MQFKILKKSKKSRARLGLLKTKNGVLQTPAFFPVATQAALKTLDSDDLKRIGFKNILCNTYHLMLRPGSKLIKKMGGLHKFMDFEGIIATDSGGFQVFSLGKGIEHGVGKIVSVSSSQKAKKKTGQKGMVAINEQGVCFRSHLDGSKRFLGPKESIKIQHELGADIIFAFDECTSPLDDLQYTKKATERTHRWAKQCLEFHQRQKSKQALFGIVQGGLFQGLREQSAKIIGSMDFFGFGIGGSLGVAIDKTKKTMYKILDWTIPLLPEEKPRHLLGIGYLEDFEKSIKRGIDLFDCVYPTRMGRHGTGITSQGLLNFNKSKFLSDKNPIDKKCSCFVCQSYSRSYITHLMRASEITGMRLLTIHNLSFFKNFLESTRKKIEQGRI